VTLSSLDTAKHCGGTEVTEDYMDRKKWSNRHLLLAYTDESIKCLDGGGDFSRMKCMYDELMARMDYRACLDDGVPCFTWGVIDE
jgi:hypothetical protein